MPNWEEWSFLEEEEAAVDEWGEDSSVEGREEDAQSAWLQLLPRLMLLIIEDCPKLRDLPRQLGEVTASLKELCLVGTKNLKAIEDFPLLSELLVIRRCEGLEWVINLPHVTDMRVNGCPNLSHVEGLDSLQQLGLGEDMQEISSRWVAELQNEHQQLHGEDLDVYTLFNS